jgi:hypothetical protein
MDKKIKHGIYKLISRMTDILRYITIYFIYYRNLKFESNI